MVLRDVWTLSAVYIVDSGIWRSAATKHHACEVINSRREIISIHWQLHLLQYDKGRLRSKALSAYKTDGALAKVF
jgi:hypothetical protein